MSDYGSNKKQICFDSITKLHADLKVRLHYDNIKIKEFFNEVIKAYIAKNENIMNFIEEIKEKKKISQNIRKKNKKAFINQEKTARQFSLDAREIESIFDILEKEYTDL